MKCVQRYDEKRVSIRDNGTAINLERLIEYIHYSNSKKTKRQISIEYDFWYVVVNGMSKYFEIHSYQDGIARRVVSEYGKITCDNTFPTQEKNGTLVWFEKSITSFDFSVNMFLYFFVIISLIFKYYAAKLRNLSVNSIKTATLPRKQYSLLNPPGNVAGSKCQVGKSIFIAMPVNSSDSYTLMMIVFSVVSKTKGVGESSSAT